MADPTVKEKLAAQGATLVGDTPEDFRGFIDSEIKEVGEGDQGRRGRDDEVSITALTAAILCIAALKA